MESNLYIACISIINGVSPELAEANFEGTKLVLTKEMTQDMRGLRKAGFTLKEVGSYFGLTESAVCNRMRLNWGK